MQNTATDWPLIARCRAEEETLAEVRCVLRTELVRAGLRDIPVPAQLQHAHLRKDPCDGGLALVGEWWRGRGKLLGSVVIHESGRLFAELLVREPLPSDQRLVVDAIVAFGSTGVLSVELQLIERRRGSAPNVEQLDLVDQHAFRRSFAPRIG